MLVPPLPPNNPRVERYHKPLHTHLKDVGGEVRRTAEVDGVLRQLHVLVVLPRGAVDGVRGGRQLQGGGDAPDLGPVSD